MRNLYRMPIAEYNLNAKKTVVVKESFYLDTLALTGAQPQIPRFSFYSGVTACQSGANKAFFIQPVK